MIVKFKSKNDGQVCFLHVCVIYTKTQAKSASAFTYNKNKLSANYFKIDPV